MKQQFAYVGQFSESGSRNSFYRMRNSKYGFKSFPNKKLAEFAHAVQTELSTADLAPKVYSPVAKIRIPEYFIKHNPKTGNITSVKKMVLSDWGYLTEIATPYSCPSEDCCGDCANDDNCANYYALCDLLDGIESYGLSYIDCHTANLGYVKRGQNKILVAIDFGAESITDEEGNYPDVCWDGAEDYECDCEECRRNYV